MAKSVVRYVMILAPIALGAAAAAPVAIKTAPVAAKSNELADDVGRDRVQAVCSGCHSPKNVIGQHHDRDSWGDILERMEGHGAKFSDKDYATITTYLAKNY